MSELAEMLRELQRRFDDATSSVHDEQALESVRIAYLGRSGEVTSVRRSIGTLPVNERPHAGKAINEAVAAMEARLDEIRRRLEMRSVEEELDAGVDVTFPAIGAATGSIHPVRRIIADSCAYFSRHGFAVEIGRAS